MPITEGNTMKEDQVWCTTCPLIIKDHFFHPQLLLWIVKQNPSRSQTLMGDTKIQAKTNQVEGPGLFWLVLEFSEFIEFIPPRNLSWHERLPPRHPTFLSSSLKQSVGKTEGKERTGLKRSSERRQNIYIKVSWSIEIFNILFTRPRLRKFKLK